MEQGTPHSQTDFTQTPDGVVMQAAPADAEHGITPESVARGYEVKDASFRAVVIFTVVLTVATAAIYAAIVWFEHAATRHYRAEDIEIGRNQSPLLKPQQESSNDPKDSTGLDSPPPPEPRLQPSWYHQSLDQDDMRKMREENRDRLEGYGWTDEKSHLAHIPIHRAFSMLEEKGLAAPLPAIEQVKTAPDAATSGGGPTTTAPATGIGPNSVRPTTRGVTAPVEPGTGDVVRPGGPKPAPTEGGKP